MESKKRKTIIIGIGLCVFAAIFINYFIKSREENNNTISFIVTNIKTFESGSVGLYSGNERIKIYNYRLSKYHDIKIGDSIYRGKHEKYLLIYRKDNNGKYQLISKEKPTGLFSES
ncbi:MAG TPA: hypothetical protein VLB74_06965 [Flavobacterium sp.]|uniref:hypothetical protein n=1 Tax=Flavobacterium sp. TaxID=239 RepID=UPI002D062908|nr:hypothetical protein [Flavobacterium sp.]HSD14372.1 hypothetical protein [Flavobacterium sp.]